MAQRSSSRRSSGARTAAATEIAAWEDDPGTPEESRAPIARPVPQLPGKTFPSKIGGRAPAPKTYTVGTANFRYWTAAEALRRVGDYWGSLLPGVSWFTSVGRQLEVTLDEDQDFNAFYDRAGLHFFHGPVDGTLVYSGESPDVVCHEFGHAVLDAIRPQLWDAAADEVAAFHESFGDMSAMLSSLQLPSVRDDVLHATTGKLSRSSRLSRLAEQLGWAIRSVQPDAVDPDSLRNAANSFFYQDPATLPPRAPASSLSSEPHSFSRVFSGAFLRGLAGIFDAQPKSDSDALLQAAQDMGQLLVSGVEAAPVVPSYYSQVAAHMLEADATDFSGRYADPLKSAFVLHGVLSLDAAGRLSATMSGSGRAARASMVGTIGTPVRAPRRREDAALPRVAVPGEGYGLTRPLICHAPAEPKRFAVASAATASRSVESPSHDRAAANFAESLFRRGRVDIGGVSGAELAPASKLSHKTHQLRDDPDGLLLSRRLFDCGFRSGGGEGYDHL
jgi:hypothetical protein